MNDKKIDTLFDNIVDENIPAFDENAKKSAIHDAKQEFSQAFSDSTRLIDNRDKPVSKFSQSIRRMFMSIINDKPTSNAFATAAIAFIGVSVYFMLPNFQSNDLQVRETNIQESFTNKTANSKTTNSKINPIEPSASVTTSISAAEVRQKVNEKDHDIVNKDLALGSIKTAIVQQPKTETADDLSQLAGANTKQQIELERAQTNAPISFSESNVHSDIEEIVVTKQEKSQQPRQRLTKRVESLRAKSLGANRPSRISDKLKPSQQTRPDLDEEYANQEANSISLVQQNPVSTFSIDVDTASYSLVRNQLNRGYLPRTTAVRAEEIINYFNYDYPVPSSKKTPFKPSVNVINSPWNDGKKLIHIGIKGYDIDASETPDSNLVFLLDVSGSMNSANKLPLVKQSINLLLDTLKPTDTISIVVYAGAAGTVLEPTNVSEKTKILSAIQRLNAGGSTAGGQGIELAYQLAEQNFKKNAVNRIILATDGDFNVGLRNNQDLKTLVERKRDKGVFLSVLGFGRNNYQDDMMQTLAQNGNGVAAYIDTLSEAKKVLVDEATGTLFTIAKDVKIQMEFNPNTISDYRLVGYETRALKREDFNNDKVDAGDIGAGHSVTAIYEITPVDSENPSIDPLRYGEQQKASNNKTQEYGFLKIRYKLPNGQKSKLIKQPIAASNTNSNSDVEFSIAAAGFAQLLRNSKHTAELTYDKVIEQAEQNKGDDQFGYRSEFIQLVRMAKIAK